MSGTRLLRLRGGGLENFILGDPEISGWGGYYHANNTFFALNVPVFGALGIYYNIVNGGSFALFVETPGATKMEIGLMTRNGVTDVLDSVCVTYVEGVTAFANVPPEFVKVKQHGATHYRRKHSAGESDWWPIEAAFGFGGLDAQLKTVCVARNGVLEVTEISGAFPKATSVTTSTSSTSSTSSTTTTTMATDPCVVQNGADSGVGSLRGVLALGTCSTVTFASGVTSVSLTSADSPSHHLTLTKGVTIDGGGAVTIKGSNTTYGVLYVNSGITVVLNGLTITGGNITSAVTAGGGIFNSGTLTIGSTTTVTVNHAIYGGGIANANGATLTLAGKLTYNTATQAGAGIDNSGTVTFTGRLEKNSMTGGLGTNSGGAGLYNRAGSFTFGPGGGIFFNHISNSSTGFGGGINDRNNGVSGAVKGTNVTNNNCQGTYTCNDIFIGSTCTD